MRFHKIRRWMRAHRLALVVGYIIFDIYIGGQCGGFIPLSTAAAAQFTTVTGTITDPNGLPYANGTIAPSLVISGSPVFTSTGLAYSPPTQPVGLSPAGSFVMQLADVTALSPVGGTWTFQVCSASGTVQPAGGKGPVCFTVAGVSISGSSQNIGTTLSAAALALTVNFGGGGSGTVNSGTGGHGTCYTATGTTVSDCGSSPALYGTLNSTSGYEIGGSAPNLHGLCGNGTNYVDCLPSVTGRAITGSTSSDSIAYTDLLTVIDHDQGASAANTETIPTLATLGATKFSFKYCNHYSASDTLTATTYTIQVGNSTAVAGATGFQVPSGACAILWNDPNNSTQWLADLSGSPNSVVDTTASVTVSPALPAEYHFNENATAATAIVYTLPTAAKGKQFCFSNAYNGSAADTGTLELLTSASGQFIIFTDGTLSATGGYVVSGGAAADAACMVGVDATHWALYVQRGTWTKH